MIKGLYTSAAGMLPRIVQQDSIANNLANTTTTGYKKGEVFLRSLIDATYALDHAAGRERTTGPEDLRIDYLQGTFDRTGTPFDLALNGPGFFRVRDTAGNQYYTRNGRFYLNADRYLVNGSGMFLMDTRNNPVRIEGNTVAIMGDGTVRVDDIRTAQIGMADFDAQGYLGLQSLGQGLFRKPAAVNEILPGLIRPCFRDFLKIQTQNPFGPWLT